MTTSNIAIIGTGNVGAGLGIRFTQSGLSVKFGVRSGKDISALLSKCDGKAEGASVQDATAWGDIVILAVPGDKTIEAAQSLGDVTGKVLVDVNNPVSWDNGPVWQPPPEGSLTAALVKAVPGAKVVKSFNTFGAEFHENPSAGGAPVDLYMAGDDDDAKKALADIAEKSGFHPVDSGPLRNAAVLENVAVHWIHLALIGGQGRNFAFQMIRH